MSYCSKCGTKLEENMKFCPKCGNNNLTYKEPQKQIINNPVQKTSTSKKTMPEDKKKLIIIIASLAVLFFVALFIFLKIFNNIYDKNHADDVQEVVSEEIEEPGDSEEAVKDEEKKEIEKKEGIEIKGDYFSLLLPEEWKDHYVWEETESEYGYYMGLYEKEAKESSYGGWLFSIAIPKEEVFYEPSYNYIGKINVNGIKKSVIVIWPTDVQFDESCADQYMEMFEKSEEVISTISANKGISMEKSSNIFGNYMLPGSDMRYVSREEIEYFDKTSLRIARNEIFARHGLIFKSDDLRKHFESTDWYNGTVSDVNNIYLNEYEKANVDLIKKLEDKK